jgi:hypothetical protein
LRPVSVALGASLGTDSSCLGVRTTRGSSSHASRSFNGFELLAAVSFILFFFFFFLHSVILLFFLELQLEEKNIFSSSHFLGEIASESGGGKN